jgi:hypothetical protein
VPARCALKVAVSLALESSADRNRLRGRRDACTAGSLFISSGFVNERSQPLDDESFARWWNETGEHELRQVLYWKWDPLGVNYAFPNTADEYDHYAPEVVSALREGASETEVVLLLSAIERERIAVPRDRTERLPEFVAELGIWFEHSQSSWSRFGPVRR